MDVLKNLVYTADSAVRYAASVVSQVKTSSSAPKVSLRNNASDVWGLKPGSSCSALVRLAGISGVIAVGFAAYSSHVTHGNHEIDDTRKRALDNANKQQFYHTIALLLSHKARYPLVTASLFVSGLVMFCGPCYAYGLANNERFRKFTPIGGILFMFGWLSFVL